MNFDNSKRLVLTVVMALLVVLNTSAQESCLKVDLQAVSISPVQAILDPGKTTQIEVVMHNNGPCPIPAGQATAQITINTDHLEIPANIGFNDECKEWTFVTSTTAGNLQNLFFRNNGAAMTVGGKYCGFRFTVKAKNNSKGSSIITLASSLSANATTADMNGSNQSAYVEVQITGKAGETIPEKKPVIELSGKANECTAILNWEDANPQIDSVEIESSNDKINFSKTGVVLPRSAKQNKYQYQAEQLNSRKYYRLRIIYKDLTSDYSAVAEIETKCKVKKGF